MFTLYRRHSTACTGGFHLKDKPQEFTKCSCPVYAYEYNNGVVARRSMKTRDWGRAQEEIDSTVRVADACRVLGMPVPGAPPEGKTLGEARDLYLADCRARKLSPLTVYNYGNTLKYLVEFLGAAKPIVDVGLEDLRQFRAQLRARLRGRWVTGDRQTDRPLSARGAIKVVKNLRAFYAFCTDNDWSASNIAKKLKAPKDDGPVTQPFTNAQTKAIVGATEGPLERALILTFLMTGFRISDVTLLRRADINLVAGATVIRARKTGQNQYMKAHPTLAQALALVPGKGEYFFSEPGVGIRVTTQRVRKTVGRILARVGIKGHPHMFRDTFAVELLTKGVDIRTVQLLLGHASVTTTELHYAPWVKAFQNRLDSAVLTLTYDEPASNQKPAAARTPVFAVSRSRAS